jgi:hypothetical protein
MPIYHTTSYIKDQTGILISNPLIVNDQYNMAAMRAAVSKEVKRMMRKQLSGEIHCYNTTDKKLVNIIRIDESK